MSDWLSRVEAAGRVALALKLSLADAAVEDAIDHGKVEVFALPKPARTEPKNDINRYAGGMTYVDMEDDQDICDLLFGGEVLQSSLEAWLSDLTGSRPNPVRVTSSAVNLSPQGFTVDYCIQGTNSCTYGAGI